MAIHEQTRVEVGVTYLDVADIASLAELKPYTVVSGFKEPEVTRSSQDALRGLDTFVHGIGYAACGLIDDKPGFLTVEYEFPYHSRITKRVRETHENNPQTMKGLFGGSQRPSHRLQPKRFGGKLQNPRVIMLEPPSDVLDTGIDFRGIYPYAYAQENAYSITAVADVPVTGKGVVGTTVDRFIIWPYQDGERMALRRGELNVYTRQFTNGVLAAERIVASGVTNSERAIERMDMLRRIVSGSGEYEKT